MCNFMSVLVLKDGSVRHHPMLDSHSDLVRYFKLPDTDAFVHHFAKAELTPTTDWTDASTWAWRIDEDVRPVWLTDDVEHAAEAAARAIAQRMVLKDVDHTLIVDGCWIVAGRSKIRDVRSGRIVRVQDSASIRNVWGSASISNVQDSASIRDVWGSASISNVEGSASIRNVWGSASIRDVWDSASIRNVWDSASISNVGDSASLDATAKAHTKPGAA